MKMGSFLFVLLCILFGWPSEIFRDGGLRVGRVVINEVLYHLPAGRDLEEWVELYNNSDLPVNLRGWVIDDRDTHRFEFQRDLTLQPGQYLLFVTNAEHVQIASEPRPMDISIVAYQTASGRPLNLQIWNNDGDEIALYDNQGQIVDYIAFGDPTGPGRDPDPPDADWDGEIPTPPPSYSIALFPNGYDRNSSAHWGFRAPEHITPGQANF
jgi:hypothetical protein